VKVTGGFYSYLETDFLATVCVNVENPNTFTTNVQGKLYNMNAGMAQISEAYLKLDAGSSGQIGFDDYNDQIGMKNWAENFAVVALRCYNDQANNGIPSHYKFYTTNGYHSVSALNTCNGKLPTPVVSASYSTPAQGNPYSVKITALSGWDFPVKLVLTTPKGIVEIERDDYWPYSTAFDSYTISVDSLDSAIKLRLVDMSPFEFESSDEVTFNLSDANNTDDDDQQS
jgi:hypothetical protein